MPKSILSRPISRLVIALVLAPIAAYAATETFTYDTLGRLKSTTYTNNTSTSYNYDSAGNRISSGPNTTTVPSAAAFTMVSSTGLSTTFKNPNGFAVVPTAAGQVINGAQGYTGISSSNCNIAVAGGSTCTIVIFASAARCSIGSYATQAYVTDAGGTVYGRNVPVPCSG